MKSSRISAYWFFPSPGLIRVLLVGAAAAQFLAGQTAELSGVVLDPSDAAVCQARVTTTRIDTGARRTAVSNESGHYQVAGLEPGSYRLEVQASGFQPVRQEGIVIEVGQRARADFKLTLGPMEQSIVVTGRVPLVNFEDGSIGSVISRGFLERLPLNGRTVQTLIALTPGVVMTRTDSSELGQFSANGQRTNANYVTLDGVGANIGVSPNAFAGQAAAGSLPGVGVTGGLNSLVSVDALQEMRILTSTYAPEYGRSPGAQIAIVTRSGSNELHGAVFEYFRNDALDANDWFANRSTLGKAALRQNNFGAVAGGPAVRNKAFFFGSYEGLRLRLPQTGVNDVPSVASRQNAPAAIRPYLDAYPVPNGPVAASGFASYSVRYSDPTTQDAGSLRTDYVVNDHWTVFGRYNEAPSQTVQRGVFATTLNTLVSTSLNFRTVTLGSTWMASPRTTVETRFNWSRAEGGSFYRNDDLGGAVVLPDSALFPSSAPLEEALFFFNLNGGQNSRFTRGKLTNNNQRQVNLTGSVSWTASAHQWKAGVDYRRLAPVYGIRGYLMNAIFAGVNGALSGKASSVTVATHAGHLYPVFANYSAYVQDVWRATRRLTVTYGVRWEVNPAPSESNGRCAAVVDNLGDSAKLALAPSCTPLYETQRWNFAPRGGVAWHLHGSEGFETILRGGTGLFYDLGSGIAAQAYAGGYPFYTSRALSNVAFPLDATQSAPPALNLNPPYSTIYAFDRQLKLPRVWQWSTAIEQSLGGHQALTIAYAGAVGRRLLRTDTLYKPNADFTTVYVTRNNATSDYHSLQVQYQRRLSASLQAQASYTWAHSIDIASSDGFFNAPIQKVDPRSDRGSSNFDVRHSFAAAASYDLPFRRPASGRPGLLGGWSVDAVILGRTATPVNVLTGTDVLLTGQTNVARPDWVAGQPLYLDDPTAPGGKRFNAAAFVVPTGRQGTLGRNALRGFGLFQLNAALHKQVTLSERVGLQLRLESFNLLNHPSFGDPAGSLQSSLFGMSTQMLARDLGGGGNAGGLNPLYQAGGARSLQLVCRLVF
jgi:hypothetical protein